MRCDDCPADSPVQKEEELGVEAKTNGGFVQKKEKVFKVRNMTL
jgi:hypothetical protein